MSNCQPLAATSSAHPLEGFAAFRGLLRLFEKRNPRLDLDTLPEHLKRDLGFATGRLSPRRDLFRD